ncbi:tyrosine-type recombinase/integrase [Lichenicoccus sp.]|uniref:tyrosine-type recombinase/integrase n=1 Tax=Lichenicoccus sp. TaxID=2781899 RepID=UPI003D11E472
MRASQDPVEQRRAGVEEAKARVREDAVKPITFRWVATLDTYVHPYLGDVPISNVATGHVLAALQPIWATKFETAARVRGRFESILDYAKAMGSRSGENPASWRGHLVKLLLSRARVAPVVHYAGLPWAETPVFLSSLREPGGISAMAVEFTILTAARSGETLGATWSEIDLDAIV